MVDAMKNPLRRRLLRDLRSDFGKYLVIFGLLVCMIGLVSGYLVADESMIAAYNESFQKYHIEDGNFESEKKLSRSQKEKISRFGINVYDLFYVENPVTSYTQVSDSQKKKASLFGEAVSAPDEDTMRVFANRDQADLVCVMDGRLAENKGEIAVDRMYATNNGLKIGDTITFCDTQLMITGLVSLSDYSALFSNNNDAMFDALEFGVGVVSAETFEGFPSDQTHYVYAWHYQEKPTDEIQEKEWSDDLLTDLNNTIALVSFTPQYANQAIRFTGEDLGSDRAMMLILLYIVIAIIAFVFAVIISNTIQKESNVIGTLRASGYTIAELIRHYMAMPFFVTLVAAGVGNVLGYTYFRVFMANLYYNSYSLPTYVTRWNADAFLETTLLPIVMMVVINLIVLMFMLTLPPLKFLRRDLRRRKQKRAIRLNPKIPFFTRFRLRVIFQNLGNYAILFLGILFANLLLLFGLGLPSLLSHFQNEIENNMLSRYQYILQVPVDAVNEDRMLYSMINMMSFRENVETKNPDAEKFTAYMLQTGGDAARQEEILIYGVTSDSRYIDVKELHEQESSESQKEASVLVSASFAEKYQVVPGDEVTLGEKYENEQYTFTVAGVYDYAGSLVLFMDQDEMNALFDLGSDYFSGYFSDSEITDIDEKYIGSVQDLTALTKVSRQLDHSMGGMADMVNVVAVIMFIILIYLMTKIIIEKNAQSISMAKILGYTTGEIGKLYIMATTIVVILFLLITLPLETIMLKQMLYSMMRSEMTGWITFCVGKDVYVKAFICGLLSYAVVALFEYRKIRKVPMDEALKHVE